MQDKYKFDGAEDSELRNQMGVCRLGVELEDLGAHNACNLKSARGEEEGRGSFNHMRLHR